MNSRQRVVVVTGGGGGIGAAVAESIGSTGAFVVTVDPLVTVDGSEQLPEPGQTTAARIIATGGAARASAVSVTDAAGIRRVFADLTDEFGGLDAVVNVAGISRPTGFANGSDDDWRSVLSVHLDGYLNVLAAALPLMAAAGRGHILGVTSGSGWRAADAGAYGCAKRAVAAVTWQLARHAPAGVVVNAVSPIAATRMVAAALGRAQRAGGSTTGGLSLGGMPEPAALGPICAHLVADGFGTCHGRVLFVAGSEVAVIDEPRLIEVVRIDGVASPGHVIEAATTLALAPAEAGQVSGGGGNARFGRVFDDPPSTDPATGAVASCAVAADSPHRLADLSAALRSRGVTCHPVEGPASLAGLGAPDAVVVAGPERGAAEVPAGWQGILDDHHDTAESIRSDSQWARAVAELATSTGRPARLVTLVDATTAGGRSRAQAAVQLARAGRTATDGLVSPFVVSVESQDTPAALVAHLVCSPAAADLAGAELVAGAGWIGLRSHPRPVGSISFGGPEVPAWFDDTLREIVRPR